MKKLTSLQIMMLMSLALGSSQIYSRESDEMAMQDDNEAVMLELQSAQDEQAKMEVLTDLIELEPKVAERIIEDEADLEATFNSIRTFVNKKNIEIDKLNKEKVVNEVEVARLAVELADAQAVLERTIAKQRAKHKHNYRHEQAIKDLFKKAEQGLKSLSKKSVSFFNQVGTYANNFAVNESARLKKTFSSTSGFTEGVKEGWTKNPFRTPKKKSKSKKNDEVVVQHGAA